jgi:hypothetical protein
VQTPPPTNLSDNFPENNTLQTQTTPTSVPSPASISNYPKEFTQDTAIASLLIKNVTTKIETEGIAIFEATALEFFRYHMSKLEEPEIIEFTIVKVIRQVPDEPTNTIENESGEKTAHVPPSSSIDLDVFFEVNANIHIISAKIDLQWVVSTLVSINLEDFLQRVEDSGALHPQVIEDSVFSNSSGTGSWVGTEGRTTTTENSSKLWVIASLGTVVVSVFITSALVTGAVRRRRQPSRHPDSDVNIDDSNETLEDRYLSVSQESSQKPSKRLHLNLIDVESYCSKEVSITVLGCIS